MSALSLVVQAPCSACVAGRTHNGKPRTYPQWGVVVAGEHACYDHAGSAAILAAAAAAPPAPLSPEAMFVILVRDARGADGRSARERAVVALDARQTAAEQAARTTTEHNGRGWRGYGSDASFGGDLAEKVRAGDRFSERQAVYAMRLLAKYSGQLAVIAQAKAAARAAAAPEPPPPPPPPPAPEPEAAAPAPARRKAAAMRAANRAKPSAKKKAR